MCVSLGAGVWAPKRARSQRVKKPKQIKAYFLALKMWYVVCGRASGWMSHLERSLKCVCIYLEICSDYTSCIGALRRCSKIISYC